jgi:hypothetical protein
MTAAQKVCRARKLLNEAEQEIRRERHAETDRQKCECGHRHNQHGISASINYTAGFCKRCRCRNFLLREAAANRKRPHRFINGMGD